MSLSAKLSICPINNDCNLTSFDNILNSNRLKFNLTKLNLIAIDKEVTLDYLLNNIIENYIDNYNLSLPVSTEYISNFHFFE